MSVSTRLLAGVVLTVCACHTNVSIESDSQAVIGGYEVTDQNTNEFKNTVLVLADGDLCSGVIVSPTLIATAGHCATAPDGSPLPPTDMLVIFGESFGSPLPWGTVDQLWVHPSYENLPAVDADDFFHAHDIAVLQLSAPIPAEKAAIVPFPNPLEERLLDSSHTVAGYGLTANVLDWIFGEGTVGVLNAASGIQLDHLLDDPTAGPKLMARQDVIPGSCFGDSGGLLANDANVYLHGDYAASDRWVVGIVSEGFDPDIPADGNFLFFECIGEGTTVSYTDVGSYVPWMTLATGHNFYRDAYEHVVEIIGDGVQHPRDIGLMVRLGTKALYWDLVLAGTANPGQL